MPSSTGIMSGEVISPEELHDIKRMTTEQAINDLSAVALESAIKNWLEAVRVHVLVPEDSRNGRFAPYTVLAYEDSPKTKYIRIVATHGGSRSAWAFVAKENCTTKSLGTVRKGDILKSAGWKVPAKHARGNVFEPGVNGCCNVVNWTGPNYLR